ncbi:hypothetical protein [Halobacterium salinarum]|uniref:hypothetical protein n=1 Tax=Halobacterium salinarum TaxID=2242 RepID=UPI002552B295|nr:hypothetical protein [Halobacterium salinarum]MDL0145481.1 hypothetical protein [Halobacterium salinarum]
MPDTAEGDSLEELREKVEELEGNVAEGNSTVEMEAYDLKVRISSEEATAEELTELASGEIEMLTQRALIGEYQELEEQSLHGRLFGGE